MPREHGGHVDGAADAGAELARGLDLEDDTVGAALELVENGRVGGADLGVGDGLVKLPAQTLQGGLVAAREGRHARRRSPRTGRRVAAGVDRLDPEAVCRPRDELLLEIGALDRLVDERKPLLAGRGLEIGCQLGQGRLVSAGAGRHGVFDLVVTIDCSSAAAHIHVSIGARRLRRTQK